MKAVPDAEKAESGLEVCREDGIYRLDPLHDPRWISLLQAHPHASVFHTPAWLAALRNTYGYVPTVLSTSPPSEPLTNGVVLCRVQSWLTGSRLVSVPFADHCQPLFHNDEDRRRLFAFLPKIVEKDRCKFIELRLPADGIPPLSGFAKSLAFPHHTLDLRPDLPVLFGRLHKSGFQRNIRRAEREHLSFAAGNSDVMLRQFYALLILTRRRHGVPPQPFAWFRNLRDCFGEALMVRAISTRGKPVASIVTLRHGDKVTYKYGGSDAGFHRLGSMPYLFWRTIQEAKEEGAKELDLGRSDPDGFGLIAFKDHMGAASRPLNYYRYPSHFAAEVSGSLIRGYKIPACLPTVLFKAAGTLVYRHIG